MLKMKKFLLPFVTLILTNCSLLVREEVAVDEESIVRTILEESGRVIDRSETSYIASWKYIDPALREAIRNLESNLKHARKRQGYYFSALLVNMPRDLLLLRRVRPDKEKIVRTKKFRSYAEVDVEETVIADGKVYKSSKSLVTFLFRKTNCEWVVTDIIIRRPSSSDKPMLLSEFLLIKRSEIRELVTREQIRSGGTRNDL